MELLPHGSKFDCSEEESDVDAGVVVGVDVVDDREHPGPSESSV